MTATIRLRFPGGRYHATPWGHHVNEGLVEWPPGPWRLLRALIAAGYSTQGWGAAMPGTARDLISRLASVLPTYRLPRGVVTHSRHYVPAPVKTTLVFDTCAVVGDGPVYVSWPTDLPEAERLLLSALARDLPYLGRAESWVVGELVNASEAEGDEVLPHAAGMAKGPGWEQVSVLASVSPEQYAAWRKEYLQASDDPSGAQHATGRANRSAKGVEGAGTRSRKAKARGDRGGVDCPEDIIACLTVQTDWLQAHGWSQPPGSQRALYWRRSDSLVTAPVAITHRVETLKRVNAVLLALASPTSLQQVLPPVWRALPQAELLHRALVGLCCNERTEPCPEILGRAEEGPLRGHAHMHILPLTLARADRIDHVLLWAPMGFGDLARRSIRRLRHLAMKGAPSRLQVSVVAEASLSSITAQLTASGHTPRWLSDVGSRQWVSCTPFVAPRHVKPKSHTLFDQIQAELCSRSLPAAVSISMMSRDEVIVSGLHRFVRRRRDVAKGPPVDAYHGIRIELAESVCGPIALGYGSHFGLGLFAAEADPLCSPR